MGVKSSNDSLGLSGWQDQTLLTKSHSCQAMSLPSWYRCHINLLDNLVALHNPWVKPNIYKKWTVDFSYKLNIINLVNINYQTFTYETSYHVELFKGVIDRLLMLHVQTNKYQVPTSLIKVKPRTVNWIKRSALILIDIAVKLQTARPLSYFHKSKPVLNTGGPKMSS